jgi:DNA-binding PadR family transcriptional regulator
MRWHNCTGFQRETIQAIVACSQADEVPYGLAIKARLTDRYEEPINHSRLYQNLDSLVEAGLVERSAVDDRTNRYDLTPAGKRGLAEQAASLQRLVESLKDTAGESNGTPQAVSGTGGDA